MIFLTLFFLLYVICCSQFHSYCIGYDFSVISEICFTSDSAHVNFHYQVTQMGKKKRLFLTEYICKPSSMKRILLLFSLYLTGHYMYIEVSGKSRDDHAHLYSPVYPATSQERCLTFWYNMNGEDVARLNVYLYQNNKFGDQIWSIQMDQGPHWHLATVPVKSATPFQVRKLKYNH